jgi:predicted AlkP superfamily phosphohydrolase/phosphomutase
MLIGWDSAPPELVFDQYRDSMPHFSRLIEESYWGKIRSTDPPITVPAWTSMFASVNPGVLGFYGFRNLRKGTYDGKWIATADAVGVDRVWDIASRYGKRCCVLGVPQTYPPKPLNGCMVSCFLTPSTEAQYTYPPELKDEVEEMTGGYMVDVEEFRTDDKEGLLSEIYRMTDKHFALSRHMLQREEWDLFMVVEMGPDRMQHGFWKFIDRQHRKYEPGNRYEGVLRDYYAHLDAQLGELLALAGDDCAVVVISDHGAKRMEGNFHVNDWLIREGLLQLKQEPNGVENISPQLIDWPRTVAWAWGGYYSRVFMNVKGREPEGCVEPDEYEAVRSDLIARFESVTDDRGRRMETKALRPEDIYTGPRVGEAPDLLVYFDDLYWRAGQDVGHESLHSFDTEIGPDDAVHDYYGILVIREPGQKSEVQIETAEAVDVAPTILELLGIPKQARMEGKSLLEGRTP